MNIFQGDFRRAFIVSFTLFVSGMLALTSYIVYRLHTDSIKNGLDIAAMHSRAFEDFLTQSLYISDLVAANISPSTSITADSLNIERIFKATIAHTPFLRSISLLDANQKIITSSNPANVGKTISLTDYLPPQQNNDPILRIGVPWIGRDFAGGNPIAPKAGIEGDNLYFIPVALSLSAEDKSRTLLLAFNPDHFLNQVAQKISAENGSVEIYRFDGTLLMDSDPTGRPGLRNSFIIQKLGLPDIEIGQSEEFIENNKNTLLSFKASRLYPFVILTRLNKDIILKTWQTEMKTLISVVLSVLSGAVILSVFYYRHQNRLIRQQQRAERAARYDHLTKLPNRRFLADYIDHAMYQTERRSQYIAIVFIDLDGFKTVNDTHGHIAGDHVLVAMATYLKSALREGDTLARIGGDEFIAILVDLAKPEIAEPIFDRLILAAAEPIRFKDQQLHVSASIGATFYPQYDNVTLDQLIQQADQAMYKAKQSGKNRWTKANINHKVIQKRHHQT